MCLLSKRIWLVGLLLAVGLGTAGCGNRAARLDRRDEQDPMLKRARSLRDAGKTELAIETYKKAILKKPNLARAHLELAFLEEDVTHDYILAIYHYRTYIKLRPDAEKRAFIEEMIDRSGVKFAASLPEKASAALAQVAELQAENKRLTDELVAARSENEALRARANKKMSSAPETSVSEDRVIDPARAVATRPRLSPPKAKPILEVDSYKVRSGDTLSKIAAKVYGDHTQWKRIYLANTSQMKSEASLKVGQDLIIPRP